MGFNSGFKGLNCAYMYRGGAKSSVVG